MHYRFLAEILKKGSFPKCQIKWKEIVWGTLS